MNELIGTETVMSKTFKGDILITDPCYVCKELDESTQPNWDDYMSYGTDTLYPDYDGRISNQFLEEREKLTKDRELWYRQHPDDWETCDYGSHFEVFGIHTYMTHSTLYGYHKAGETCQDDCLVVEGKGNINFTSRQTGL